MAKRRMISVDVLGSDKYVRLPFSSQAIYIQMILNADDDGFVDNVESLIRILGIEKKYYRELINREFVIEFDTGVAAIAHWRKMNKVRADRYCPTDYTKELKSLTVDEKDRYIKA